MGKDEDEVTKFHGYDYRSNSNVVLTTKRKKRSQNQEPSGEPETLSGKELHKMGDRVEYSKPPTSAKKKKKQEQKLSLKKKQSILDINTSQEHYNPKTDETRTVYESILDKVQHYLGDVDHDTLRGAVDELLTILHDENQSDHHKQEEVSQILSPLPNDEFAKLYQLCKRITDFVVSDVVGDNYQEIEAGIALVSSDEEEDDETEGLNNQTVGYVVSSDSESDISDSEQPTIVEASKMEDEEDELDVSAIDTLWLSNELSNYYSDSNECKKLSDGILEILNCEDEHDIENQLVQILDYDKIDLVQKLMRNRLKIIYCTRLNKASTKEEQEKIEQEMMSNDHLVKILEKLKGIKISNRTRTVASSRGEKDNYQWKGERVINLDNLAFEEGSHLMSNRDFTLPVTASTAQFKGYEQITIPYSSQEKPRVDNLIEIKSLPEWAHRAFPNMAKLNAVQSIIFKSAFYSPENLLICAPTGAGKTNVAVLTMLHEIGLHMDENFERLNDIDFKMIYIAPMKALVQEVVGNLSERLKPYNIVVQELTGDRNMTKQQIDETQIIVTTPEKWDIVTRKSGDRTYVEKVKLIIIDEIHLLHDERGPVLESIVARTIRQQESTRQNIRLVGLSATLPNYKDVATFLRVQPDNLFYFDSSFRPCPLDQYYIGVNEKKPFKRHKLMNEIVYNKVVEIAGKHQIIVFVHSRKDTYKTAKALRDMAIENDTIGKFVKQGSATSEILKEASQKDANGAELKELLPFGFGIHHAGMTRNDRTLVEDLFDDERLQVLVSTATLAWGVNLPARRVIIKGTQVYSPEKGDWTELSALDVMQMIGRAGRFPRDSRGEGFIVTTQSHLQYYLALLNQQLPIESQFIKALPDNLNAEIVLGTVQNIDEAINWLGYTYLYIRMLRNPLLYGITKEDVEQDESLYHWRRDLIFSAASTLEKNGLIKFDKRAGDFQPTDLGRVASHYYVTHKSIATFNNNMKPNLSDIELFRLFSLSDEFSQMTVRQEEKLELSKLIHSVPIPIKESSDDPSAKVNVLLQAYISRLRLNGFALISDMTYITQSAARIARALFEIIMHRGWAQLASKVLNLAKMIEHKMWYSQTPLRQFPKIEQTILKQLEGKNTLWERLYDYTPAELGRLVHHNQRGKDLYKYIHQFPRLDLTASVQPITPSTLRIELTISPDFQYNKSIHGAAQTFWLFVEDVDGEVILHHESFVLKQKYAEENHYVSFTVPIYEPLPPHYFIKVISDRWLHSEQTLPISFRHLILPQKAPLTTELLDLPPLEISTLKNSKYEQILSNMGIIKFNPIQTQVFRSIYHSEDSILIAAPGGSGKSLCGVLAIMKMFVDNENSKCVYIAPIPSVAKKREKKWLSLFKQMGKRVVNLTGNLAKDLVLFEQGDVIISTPEHFDMFSRKWKARKSLSNVKLVIVDELHMIGGEVGPIIEVVTSRIRYMSSQLETNIRIVGLSTSILNAKDVADWLGTKKENCFNFHPRYRSIPLEINIQGFTQSSYNARQVAMSKPAYKVIKQKSRGEQTIFFTSSPKQASFISSDLIDHLINDIDSNIFIGNKTAIDGAIGLVDSSSLKDILGFGIAFYHETLSSNDKQIVEELYSSGAIKILIVTHQMCWGMEQKSKLVIIMGTEYYNGKEHRYADYSIIDMVQMMSRSGRVGIDKDSTCYIFCASSRKDYLLKFLYEPFPVESHLDHFLYDPLNAEISSKIIENKQGAVDYLTWTFLYRRIRKNPNYYNLSGTTKIHLSDYLSELVESSLEELQKCNCILVEDDDITAMNLGTIAAHYYVKHSTIEIYSTTINSKTKLRGLLEVLGYSTEFEQLPIRQKENHLLRKLFTHAPLKVEKPNYTQISTKVNLILQSHFSRTRLTPAMEMDKKVILLNSVKLLRAMVDVIGNEGFLTPALAAMEMSQMITQALWDKDPFLMQLPHFTKEICSKCEQGGIVTIFDLINMEDDERNQLLGFNEQQMIDVAKALNRYPNIELAHEIVTANEDITTNSTITLAVRFDADDVGDEPIYAPYFPEDKLEEWWVVIGDHFNNEIKSIKRLPIKQSSETMVKFLAPSKPGKYEFKLYFMCDSYTGCDQEYPISFTVLEGDDEDMEDEN